MSIKKRREIKAQAKRRARRMYFGQPVTNVCAGKENPMRHCYFVRYKPHRHEVEVTDRKGKFAWIDANVIFASHLHDYEAQEFFSPIWEAYFGNPEDAQP